MFMASGQSRMDIENQHSWYLKNSNWLTFVALYIEYFGSICWYSFWKIYNPLGNVVRWQE